ncbi:hypothetical protein T06_9491 [Trichinella sp. T6]|nr:hypothetical protein T06_9491 [Trichinella sp. T6]
MGFLSRCLYPGIRHMAQAPSVQTPTPLSFIKPYIAPKAATNQISSHDPPMGRNPHFGYH